MAKPHFGDELADAIVQDLIGCAWGRAVAAPDDMTPCSEQAVQIVVLHLPNGAEAPVKLCARHRERILAETEPHAE